MPSRHGDRHSFSLWRKIAGQTTDEGRTFSGRAEIEAAIRAGVAANRGSKLVINADTVRVLGPESLLEKGSTTVTGTDGESSGSLYTAMYLKKDGGGRSINLSNHPCLRLRRATTLKSSRGSLATGRKPIRRIFQSRASMRGRAAGIF